MRGVDDAGTSITRATTAFAVGRIRQSSDLLKGECAAVSGFARLGSARMLDEIRFSKACHAFHFRR